MWATFPWSMQDGGLAGSVFPVSGARGRDKRRRGKVRGERTTRGEGKQDKGFGSKSEGGQPDSSKGINMKCECCREAG